MGLADRLHIIEIVDRGEYWQVLYSESEPQSCAADMATTYPYCFVSVERTNKPIKFSREMIDSCD